MAVPGGRNTVSQLKAFVKKIREYIKQGETDKLFSDDNFVLELLKYVYEDTVDPVIKTELVLSLEEYGYESLSLTSAEQVISSLLDVFNQSVNGEDRINYCLQLLITLTTLTIYHSQINTTIGSNVIKRLYDVVKKVNHTPSRRIRGCCCRCLVQIEETSPGVLLKYKDEIMVLVKDEKTHVNQDYVILLSALLASSVKETETTSVEKNDKELLPAVSYIMENVPLLTTSGLWSVIQSLINILHNTTHISPSIFKPFMLHHMATFDPIIFHIVLVLQKEFEGEVLSKAEENDLLERLVTGINHPSFSSAHRLLLIQWLKGYPMYNDNTCVKNLPDYICTDYQSELFPSVFDSLDLQVGKLALLCRSKRSNQGDEFTANLLKQCGEIQQLTEAAGRHKPALALYKSLFVFYSQHSTTHLIQTIQGITHKLLGNYPAQIPLVLNFLQCVRQSSPESSVYMDILSTLHQSVLSISYQDVFNQYQFYLQVFQTSAKEKDLNQLTMVQYLHGLIDYTIRTDVCNWYFGNTVLSVCRNILSYQDTGTVFKELGDLLHDLMTSCDDTDIKDRARFYYALLTNASDKKIHSVLNDRVSSGTVTGQNFSSLLPGSMIEQDKAKVIKLTQTLFTWERLKISPVFSTRDENLTLQDVSYEEYKKVIDKIDISLQMTCKLTLIENEDFDSVHAISVNLDDSQHYKPVQNSHVTVMTKCDSCDVVLTFIPVKPFPSTFPSRVLFAEKNKTYSSDLPESELRIEDLLLPFPWHLVNITDKSQFWSNLWSQFTDTSNYPGNGVESHKISSCSLNKLQTLWKSYQLTTDNVSENDYQYLMLLPPQHHILLKIKQRQENLVISMATDYWHLLPFINNYLNSLNAG